MQTSGSISLNENVAAVCAPSAGQDYSGQTAVVSGWGTLRSGIHPILEITPLFKSSMLFCLIAIF